MSVSYSVDMLYKHILAALLFRLLIRQTHKLVCVFSTLQSAWTLCCCRLWVYKLFYCQDTTPLATGCACTPLVLSFEYTAHLLELSTTSCTSLFLIHCQKKRQAPRDHFLKSQALQSSSREAHESCRLSALISSGSKKMS